VRVIPKKMLPYHVLYNRAFGRATSGQHKADIRYQHIFHSSCLQSCCAYHGKASLGDHREHWFDCRRNVRSPFAIIRLDAKPPYRPSSTPWNGLYCASKAATNSISEVLSMELKPFNISVLHVAPGAVKSNISSNSSSRFTLAADTLYSDYFSNIIKRMNTSQGPGSMPTKDFAQQVVSKALQKKPPRYMSIGGHSRILALFKWLPRGFVLYYMWRMYSGRT